MWNLAPETANSVRIIVYRFKNRFADVFVGFIKKATKNLEPDRHRFKQLFIVALTLFVVAAGWLGAFVIHNFLPGHYVKAYPFIPFFFFLCGLGFVAMLHRTEQRKESMVRMFLLLKAVKIGASVVILGLYAWLVGEQFSDFAWIFLIFYVLYLIFEMFALSRYEKDLKKKRDVQPC